MTSRRNKIERKRRKTEEKKPDNILFGKNHAKLLKQERNQNDAKRNVDSRESEEKKASE